MKKYLWFGLWLCLIATSSLAVETTATENISESTEIEGNYLVSKVNKTHKILEIPSEVEANFSDETILTVYETSEPMTIKDRPKIYSLFTYHYVQSEKTLSLIDGNFEWSSRKVMGQSINLFLSTVLLPIVLVVVLPLRFTPIPFRSVSFFLIGLIMAVVGGKFSAVFFLVIGIGGYLLVAVIYDLHDDVKKADLGHRLVTALSIMAILVCSMIGYLIMVYAYKVSNDLYVLPSLMLEFAILSLILFILEVTVYQWSNRSRGEEIPVKIPLRDKVL